MNEKQWYISNRGDVQKVSTPFWQEYARALNSLIRDEKYTVSDIIYSGQEQYWKAYIDIVEAQINDLKSIGDKIDRAKLAFETRIEDNAINDDQYQIEGCGDNPLSVDFRLESLTKFIFQD